ncbi:hypothetical protein L5014_07295 [Paraburkholderia sp. RG36]|uniref:Uncharacterized protein n=2 Tax=Paraburkholderia tagetis TaxID=2913261 RepID=A0A9X1RN37_9BURK|nr:hypothetical protein [Paraburkholderia tagetis]
MQSRATNSSRQAALATEAVTRLIDVYSIVPEDFLQPTSVGYPHRAKTVTPQENAACRMPDRAQALIPSRTALHSLRV